MPWGSYHARGCDKHTIGVFRSPYGRGDTELKCARG